MKTVTKSLAFQTLLVCFCQQMLFDFKNYWALLKVKISIKQRASNCKGWENEKRFARDEKMRNALQGMRKWETLEKNENSDCLYNWKVACRFLTIISYCILHNIYSSYFNIICNDYSLKWTDSKSFSISISLKELNECHYE